jgi:predicted kinase
METTTATPKVILMVGGPAAGKSTIIARDYADMKAIDCDQFKPLIEGYDPKRPELVHEQSSIMCTRALFAALSGTESFVFDSTGTNAEKMVAIIKQAQSAGFTTEVVYRDLLSRRRHRAQSTARPHGARVHRPREAFAGGNVLRDHQPLRRRRPHREQLRRDGRNAEMNSVDTLLSVT